MDESARSLFLFQAVNLTDSQLKMAVTKIDCMQETVIANAAENTDYVPGDFPQTEETLKLFLGDLAKQPDEKSSGTFMLKETPNLQDQVTSIQQVAPLCGVVKNQGQSSLNSTLPKEAEDQARKLGMAKMHLTKPQEKG